jgi:hypothetical protein
MSRKNKKATSRTATSEPDPREKRNDRAFIFLWILVCCILAGSGPGIGQYRSQSIGVQLMGWLYGIGGLAGVVGLVATLRGSQMWSRLVYLLALAFPVGTYLTMFVHISRVDYLAHLDRVRAQETAERRGDSVMG